MKIYSIVFNLNTPSDSRIWVPQNSSYKIAVKAIQNGEDVALSGIQLFDGNTEITADEESYAGYKTFSRNSTASTSKELTVKALGQTSKLYEIVTDSTVFEVGGEGGGEYELPIASSTTLGGVKVGNGLGITEDGTLSANVQEYELPVASDSTLGGIKVGTNLTIAGDGTLSVTENNFVMKTNMVAVLSGTYEDDTTFNISAYVKQ